MSLIKNLNVLISINNSVEIIMRDIAIAYYQFILAKK